MAIFRCNSCGGINRVPAGGDLQRARCGRCKRPLDADGAPQAVAGDELERTLRSATVPVLVDFWAPWCAPCRTVAPLIDRLARDHAGRLLVLKVNSDENPELSARHRIQGIPSLLLFERGRETDRQVGALPAPALAAWLRQHLSDRASTTG